MGGLEEWVDGWTRGMGRDGKGWVDGWSRRFVGMGGMGAVCLFMGMGVLII